MRRKDGNRQSAIGNRATSNGNALGFRPPKIGLAEILRVY